jgi:hypothetical protein
MGQKVYSHPQPSHNLLNSLYSHLWKLFKMQKILFATLLLGVGVAAGQRQQRATLYTGTNQAGEYIVIPQTYVADLSTYNFDNRAYSYCLTGT